MSEIVIGLTSALWLGILTSISPCPLATNIAAISYLSKNIVHIKTVLRSGIAYTLGRMIAYAMLGFIIVNALLTVPVIAQFLQNYLNKISGNVVLLGDFNLSYNKIKNFFNDFDLISNRIKTCSNTPIMKLFYNKDVDHILTKGFNLKSLSILDGYSDHKAICSELEFV